MIISIYGETHTITVGDTDKNNFFIGFDSEDEAYHLTATDANALLETLKILLYKQ